MKDPIQHATNIVQSGGVIAYPTEAVYGLGCDPFNQEAVLRLLKIKNRSVDKGLILIASDWHHVENLVTLVDASKLQQALDSWPGHNTWVFPASTKAPRWICGKFDSIALRISAHPICRKLCEAINGPLVSTSANPAGKPAIRNLALLKSTLARRVDFIVPGDLGDQAKPSTIRDIKTGKVFR